jgi:hypothetical protein
LFFYKLQLKWAKLSGFCYPLAVVNTRKIEQNSLNQNFSRIPKMLKIFFFDHVLWVFWGHFEYFLNCDISDSSGRTVWKKIWLDSHFYPLQLCYGWQSCISKLKVNLGHLGKFWALKSQIWDPAGIFKQKLRPPIDS